MNAVEAAMAACEFGFARWRRRVGVWILQVGRKREIARVEMIEVGKTLSGFVDDGRRKFRGAVARRSLASGCCWRVSDLS